MKTILITGASGNVGTEVIKALTKTPNQINIVAGVRDIEKDKSKLSAHNIGFVKFDFTDTKTYSKALENCEVLFLLRPPQISKVKKYFVPLIETAKLNGIKHIVFLSVQGVEKNKLFRIIRLKS
jgi:uncharacterized protein YbjT (DUF2867 family)